MFRSRQHFEHNAAQKAGNFLLPAAVMFQPPEAGCFRVAFVASLGW
jgi:hypothetical protein